MSLTRFAFAVCTGLAMALPAQAQEFPTRPVTIVLPYPPGASTDFIARLIRDRLEEQLKVPVVPVENVAGLYWPRRKFLRFPGTIKARFLPPIPPGLEKEEFMRRLIGETESACDRFLVEAAHAPNPPPMPPTAVKRLAELGATAAAKA